KNSTISVTSFLPSGVQMGANNTFLVTTGTVSLSRQLAADCSACTGTAPKPSFFATVADSSGLPTGVGSGTLATGSSIAVQVTNNLGFDPISTPAAATPGWYRLVVSNNGVIIGSDSVNGATGSMPIGTFVRNVPVSGTIVGSKRVTLSMTLNSPAG